MTLEEEKVLIIGGAGFIGKSLIRKLLMQKTPLVILDVVNRPASLQYEENENFRWIKYSYIEVFNKKDELRKIIRENNIKIAIHLATTMFPVESQHNIERDCFENVYSNVILFNILYEEGCDKIIFSSSGGTVYGHSDREFDEDDKLMPNISYGLSKCTTENYLRLLAKSFDKKSISMRISNPYGEEQNLDGNQGVIPIFIKKIYEGQPIKIIGSIDNRRDYIYIDDLVSAFIKLINYTGNFDVFNIGYGKSNSLSEIINNIEIKTNKIAKIERDHSNSKNGNIMLNVNRAKNELNWKAVTCLSDGIESIVKYHGLK
jgi:nucleoside-diphosphate-sugar epimerase